ncbi:hypothetical protein PRIPAC_86877 [Pristionchus pacificus]|uniref:Cytochrome P450 n=1 Tax=Pristionchus pacificus TaxID=54126 RepID=A0A2A6BKM4_PRIPA|nr:hypothetical protein PRIPAC_86877 [Pristionchus pacificus]|eukprot:PDM66464.1 cytochrome P450 [Pristionchus pacificus]
MEMNSLGQPPPFSGSCIRRNGKNVGASLDWKNLRGPSSPSRSMSSQDELDLGCRADKERDPLYPDYGKNGLEISPRLDKVFVVTMDPRITPFSIGKRACLGETLARMEIFVMFATFVQNCHFTPVGKVPPAVEFNYGFTRSVNHFDVKIEPRN